MLDAFELRKHPEYTCEAFQCIILDFIISNCGKHFMACRVDTGNSLREVEQVVQSQALRSTPTLERDRSERQSIELEQHAVPMSEHKDDMLVDSPNQEYALGVGFTGQGRKRIKLDE